MTFLHFVRGIRQKYRHVRWLRWFPLPEEPVHWSTMLDVYEATERAAALAVLVDTYQGSVRLREEVDRR